MFDLFFRRDFLKNVVLRNWLEVPCILPSELVFLNVILNKVVLHFLMYNK